MSLSRFHERRKEFVQAITRLGEACAVPADDLVRDAIIQRFELFWKAMQAYFEHQGTLCASPRPPLNAAFSFTLIPDQTEADVWFRMIEDRNLTSHTYHCDLAIAIHGRIVAKYAPLLVTAASRLESLR